jgi:hypothetical protein
MFFTTAARNPQQAGAERGVEGILVDRQPVAEVAGPTYEEWLNQ